MEAILLRSLERILSVLIGGMSIYLGYRLFLKVPQQTDSSGKIILPGGINIFLSRIGPGVFFSLFGTLVVGLSLYYQTQIELSPGLRSAQPLTAQESVTLKYQGFGERPAAMESEEDLAARRSEARRTIYELNAIPPMLKTQLAPAKLLDVRQALRESKLAVIFAVWGKDWGDYTGFKKWLEDGELKPVPKGFQTPLELFHQGEMQENP